jgi:hypothetical protein
MINKDEPEGVFLTLKKLDGSNETYLVRKDGFVQEAISLLKKAGYTVTKAITIPEELSRIID